MANATARVGRAFRSYRNDNLTHSYGTLSAALQLYTGAMIGITVGGYLAKFDDTANLDFFGIILEKDGNPKLPNDGTLSATAGAAALALDVKQPPSFELNITGVAITDIGRRVYAVDDQTGTLDPSTLTYANMVGTVKDLVYAMDGGAPVANYALVEPIYEIPNGNQLQIASASGAISIKPSTVLITKVGVAALTMADPTTGVHDGLVMTFTSVTASAHTLITPSGFNASGTTATWGGAKGDGVSLMGYLGKWYSLPTTRNVNFT